MRSRPHHHRCPMPPPRDPGHRHRQDLPRRAGPAERQPRGAARRGARPRRRERRRQVDPHERALRRAHAGRRASSRSAASDHAGLDPFHAQRLGVGFVHQEPAALADLSILENMTLGSEARRSACSSRTARTTGRSPTCGRVGLDIDPALPVARLSIAQRHLLDVAKALLHRPRILIMDEPTATLTPPDAEHASSAWSARTSRAAAR